LSKRRRTRAKRADDAPTARSRLTLLKKLVFALVTTVAFFVALELVLAACGVRPVLDTEDPFVGFSSYIPLFVPEQQDGGQTQLVIPDNKRPWFNEQRFLQEKPVDTYRVFCLGGSTTYGRPYDDETSFCGWLRELLPVADSSRKWEVINTGGVSYASYRVAKVMEELTEYEPDLFVVYSGHNEFLEERTYGSLREMSSVTEQLGALLNHSRTYAVTTGLMAAAGLKSRTSTPVRGRDLLPREVNTLLDNAIGPDVYRRDEQGRRDIFAHYEFNLNRIIDIAEAAGAGVVLVTPASNLRDCSPFKSEHGPGLGPTELSRCHSLYDQAAAARTAGRFDEALKMLDEAAAIDDRFADALYERGRVLLELQRYDEAKAALVRARDEDICPLRAPTEVREIVLRVAQQRRVPLVDFAAYVGGRAANGIPGYDLFLDHVHPSIDGHRDLAVLLVEQMQAAKIVVLSSAWNEEAIREVSDHVNGRIDSGNHATAFRNMSKVLGWAGKNDESDHFALLAVDLLPDDAEAQHLAGNACFRQGDLPGALEHYRRSIELDAISAPAYYGVGLVLAEQDKRAEAIASYRQCIVIDEAFVDAHYNLAILLDDDGQLEEAAEHYRTAIALQPGDWLPYSNLGIVYLQLGRRADARQQFEQAIHVNPQFADAHTSLGWLYGEQGELEKAIGCFREALRHQPDDVTAARNLEEARQQLSRKQKAK
jgi:tetratricopeptide (TPR) repeat protein